MVGLEDQAIVFLEDMDMGLVVVEDLVLVADETLVKDMALDSIVWVVDNKGMESFLGMVEDKVLGMILDLEDELVFVCQELVVGQDSTLVHMHKRSYHMSLQHHIQIHEDIDMYSQLDPAVSHQDIVAL